MIVLRTVLPLLCLVLTSQAQMPVRERRQATDTGPTNRQMLLDLTSDMARLLTAVGENYCTTQTALIDPLPDSSLTGTSIWDEWHGYSRSKLNTQHEDGVGIGAWSTRVNVIGEYIQADFGQELQLEAVATQGRAGVEQFVTRYTFAYSVDNLVYEYILNSDGGARVFTGNHNQNMIIKNKFGSPIQARYVRLYPQAWVNHISLRWEVYGCDNAST